MKEPVHHGFDSEPALSFLVHDLEEGGENVGIETV
jgi:hypothetical protein